MITSLDMVWKGLAIGVIISAPMGPVGMLCIQKTIAKGRKVGLLTGVGATLSDLFYCLITGFGLSLIEEFLERNQSIIQIFGSVVLIAFGVYLYRQKQPKEFHPRAAAKASLKKDTLSGFLFTLSNPLIIFLIIGLFARFNFLLPEMKFYHYFVGYAAIAGGALLWWWFITFTIDKIRAHFNESVQRIINRLIGIIIMIFGVVGIITASAEMAKGAEHVALINPAETYLTDISLPPAPQDHDNSIVIPLPDTISPCRVLFHIGPQSPQTARSAILSPFSRKKNSGADWEIRLHDSSGNPARIAIRAERLEKETFARSASERAILLTAIDLISGETLAEAFPETAAADAAANAYIMTVEGNRVRMTAAGKESRNVLEFKNPTPVPLSAISILNLSCDSIRLPYLSASLSEPDRERFLARSLSAFIDSIARDAHGGKRSHLLDGRWKLYSATFPADNVEIGGDYLVEIDTPEDGIHAIRYLSGATKHAGKWKPGELKGVLVQHETPGNYYLDWIDSEGRLMRRNLVASLDPQTNILTLKFPETDTTLSLIKTD